MIILESRGGLYGEGPRQSKDFQEPYLRYLFSFIGLTDVSFVQAVKLGFGPEAIASAVSGAEVKIAALLTAGSMK